MNNEALQTQAARIPSYRRATVALSYHTPPPCLANRSAATLFTWNHYRQTVTRPSVVIFFKAWKWKPQNIISIILTPWRYIDPEKRWSVCNFICYQFFSIHSADQITALEQNKTQLRFVSIEKPGFEWLKAFWRLSTCTVWGLIKERFIGDFSSFQDGFVEKDIPHHAGKNHQYRVIDVSLNKTTKFENKQKLFRGSF